MYYLLKAYKRAFDYIRGLKLFLIIKICGRQCHNIPRVGKGVIWKYPPHKGIEFGKHLYLGPYCFLDINPNAKLKIENNVGITLGAVISASHLVHIANDVLIGEYCSIRDSDHEMSKDLPIRQQPLKNEGGIMIEDDVWLGRNSVVLGAITIKKGCVIGADGFINKNADTEYGIYIGKPVKLRAKRM